MTGRMKLFPNILTVSRMLGSVCILFFDMTGMSFWAIYFVCGLGDMVDGWLARRLDAVTKAGAILDSMADLCFVVCCGWQLLPILKLPPWLWIWAGAIAMIKVLNQVSAFVMFGKCCFPHTVANKATGFLLFVTIPMTLVFESIVPVVMAAVVATFAAVQEGRCIRTKKVLIGEEK